MTCFEKNYLVSQYLLFITQVLLVLVTTYFYLKLVKNDNDRMTNENNKEIKLRCKNLLKQVDSPGALQRAGARMRELFPDKINLILQAYEEFIETEDKTRSHGTLLDFVETMNQYEPNEWPYDYLLKSKD
ncbi:MAG: hypothetical protein M9899_03815 [Bdellovibrionaceae bacterium]|nr:hypothetical protein [Pseudobdellovibrionaceae bacterium]